MNLENIKKIYFIGIGGIAMSATAGIARECGIEVAGSDSKSVYAPAKDVLDNYHIPYFIGYDQKNIETSTADLYIVSAGEGLENPEVKYLVDNQIPFHSFPELLYALSEDRLRIVVAGTHGKSTTTGMIGYLLNQIDSSSYMVGGVLQNTQSNFQWGAGHYAVFEGDEYKSLFDDPTPKFHYYKPDILVLNNLEYDHPDVFSSLDELKAEFYHLIENMPPDGLIIYNADDANLAALVHTSNIISVSFGIDTPADVTATDVHIGTDGTTFIAKRSGDRPFREEYTIQLPGKINIYNALASVTLLRVLGFTKEQIQDHLYGYLGIKRRFEVIGNKNGVVVVDDYAHHPTAVRETLQAARLKFPMGKLWAVFEPHTFSRTQATLPDLVKSFDAADEVLIAEIYPARENVKDATISGSDVVSAVKLQRENGVRLVADKKQALDILKREAQAGDTIVVMAVGSFNKLAYEFLEI